MNKSKEEMLEEKVQHNEGDTFKLRTPSEPNGFTYEVVESFFGAIDDNWDKCKVIHPTHPKEKEKRTKKTTTSKMKQEFEMLQSEMDFILDINKHNSNTVMMIGGVDFSHNLTDAINAYWRELGDKYGFIWDSVEGSAKGKLFFLATPKEKVIPKTAIEIEMDKYDSLQKIVSQLESCNYESKGGFLENNIAFMKLKQLANK